MKDDVLKRISSKNLIPMAIYEILFRHSDYEHKLTQKQIIDYLQNEYQVEDIERKSISRTIERLREEWELPIESDRKGTWLEYRLFEPEELMLLITSIFTSRYVPSKYTEDLTRKISSLGSDYFKACIKYTYTADDLYKTDNKALFYNIGIITDAIEQKKQIEYDFNKFELDKKLHYSSSHKVSPFRIISKNGRLYLMAYHEKHNSICFHRIDHLSNMRIINEKGTPASTVFKGGLTNKKIAERIIYMFSEDLENIVFRVQKDAIDSMVDWLGNDFIVNEYEAAADGTVKLSVKAAPSAFKYFSLQFLNQIEVISPAHLREEIISDLEKGLEKYRK